MPLRPDRTIGRYGRWYARLLRLYPRPYQQRFAEPMAQTFADLCRERTDADRDLLAFAIGTFLETSAGIFREYLMHTTTQMNRYLRWIPITAAVLAVAALAMAFNVVIADPDRNDGLNWGPMDFAIVAVLVLGAGLLYEYASSTRGSVAHRAATSIAVLAVLGLVWVNLAVGMMRVEQANLMYVLVLFVALIGAVVGRFDRAEASMAMFAAAGAHLIVVAIGLATGLGPELRADVFFIAAWVASGLLFRWARLAQAPSS